MPIKQKKTVRKRVILAFCISLLFLSAVVFVKISSYIHTLYQVTFDKKIDLKKTQQERINVLLLGIGGGVHEGPLLTDTIIFASIDPQKNKAILVSIPRDLWVTSMQAKINTVYAFSEAKDKGSGLQKTKTTVQEILGQKIDYGFRIDFTGFIKAVDTIGGIDLVVDITFDDYEYPITGKEEDDCGFKDEEFEKRATAEAQLEAFPCRYEKLHFDKGLTQMNGETALKFVRSRHALGPEGTDFARSKRQEKIIRAFKDKIFSLETFLNPIKLVGLYTILQDSIDTDIKQEEIDDFIKLARKMQKADIESVVLDVGDEQAEKVGLLVNPPVSEEFRYQWVIIPRRGSNDYSEIHSYIACIIKNANNCTITPLPEDK